MSPHPPALHRTRSWRRPLAASVGGLLLAGCLTIPNEPRTLTSEADGRVRIYQTACAAGEATPHPATGTTLGGETLRLAIWNIHKEDDADWSADLERVSADADLVLLQEARDIPALRDTLARRNYSWTLGTSFQYLGEDTGVLTAARAQPESWCSLRTTEPWLRLPKSTLVTRYRLGNGTVLAVANLHGINFALGTDEFREQLDALRAQLANHREPVILAGDFNTWSRERQQIVATLAQALGLTPVDYPHDTRSRFMGEPVDHVYFRGLEAKPAEVVTVTSSDHNAVRVSFRVVNTTRVASRR